MKQRLLEWIQKKQSRAASFKESDFLMTLKHELDSGSFSISDHVMCEELDWMEIKNYTSDILSQHLKSSYDSHLVGCCALLVDEAEKLGHVITWGTCDTCGEEDRDISIFSIHSSLYYECFYGCGDLRSIPQGENYKTITDIKNNNILAI